MQKWSNKSFKINGCGDVEIILLEYIRNVVKQVSFYIRLKEVKKNLHKIKMNLKHA